MFSQTFSANDLVVVGLLVVLEGVLSIDNALVLGLLARRLPRSLQSKALTYGLAGAFAFRLIAIVAASSLLHWRFAKLLGGAYLIWVALKHFFREKAPSESTAKPPVPERAPDHGSVVSARERAFWSTVAVIELTDIAFAVDSIVAAIGVVGPPPAGQRHPKLWVVLIGGMIGVLIMRWAAVIFIRLLERFPGFESAAYLLVTTIGFKLTLDYGFNTPENPNRLNFHSHDSPAFWLFWICMVICFVTGFLPQRRSGDPNLTGPHEAPL